MLFDAHWHAFCVFGGIPGSGIYDNMKTTVDRVGRGKQRDINARFKARARGSYAPNIFKESATCKGVSLHSCPKPFLFGHFCPARS